MVAPSKYHMEVGLGISNGATFMTKKEGGLVTVSNHEEVGWKRTMVAHGLLYGRRTTSAVEGLDDVCYKYIGNVMWKK